MYVAVDVKIEDKIYEKKFKDANFNNFVEKSEKSSFFV
jgi:hypothetical protein